MTLSAILQAIQNNLWAVAIVALATTARFMIAHRQSLSDWIRGFVFAAFISLIAYYITLEYALRQNWQIISIAIASFFAENLLKGLQILGEAFARDPFVILSWLERLRRTPSGKEP